MAEAWLIAQEPYLASRDFGHTVDGVEKLIRRHEAFEKSTASWAERFAALEKPTTVSWECVLGGPAATPQRRGDLKLGTLSLLLGIHGQYTRLGEGQSGKEIGDVESTSECKR